MPFFVALALLLTGCAIAPVRTPDESSAAAEKSPAPAVAPATAREEARTQAGSNEIVASSILAATTVAQASQVLAQAGETASANEQPSANEGEEDESEGVAEDAGEGESHEVSNLAPGIRYTAELADPELEKLWKSTPAALGSVSVGFVDAGRLLNGVQFPEGDAWTVVSPSKAWATRETIEYVQTAIRAVRVQFPNAPQLRVNQISGAEGGYLRPHQSHQNGRDVDLAFYYPTAQPIRTRMREMVIDLPLNWALIKAIATQTDVQMILVDKRVQKRLYDYALAQGEDRAWLGTLFHGKDALLKHARGHRDHFHVRFFNPRAQELGRRVAPLLALQPEHNLAMHKVRRGDNLGMLSRRYGSSAAAIRKANHMKNNALHAGITISIPLRGACVHCPVPPALVIPERRMPPGPLAVVSRAGESGTR